MSRRPSSTLPIESPADLERYGLLDLHQLGPVWRERIKAVLWAAYTYYPGPLVGMSRVKGVAALTPGPVQYAMAMSEGRNTDDLPPLTGMNFATTLADQTARTYRPFMLFSSMYFGESADMSATLRLMEAQQQSGFTPFTNPAWLSRILHEALHPTATDFLLSAGSKELVCEAFEEAEPGSAEHLLRYGESAASAAWIDAMIRTHVSEDATNTMFECLPEALVRALVDGDDAPPLCKNLARHVNARFRFDAPDLDAVNQERDRRLVENRSASPPDQPHGPLWIPEWSQRDAGQNRRPNTPEWIPLSSNREATTLFTRAKWLEPFAGPVPETMRRYFDDPDLVALVMAEPLHALENASNYPVIAGPSEHIPDPRRESRPRSKIDLGELDTPRPSPHWTRTTPDEPPQTPLREDINVTASTAVDRRPEQAVTATRRGRRRGRVDLDLTPGDEQPVRQPQLTGRVNGDRARSDAATTIDVRGLGDHWTLIPASDRDDATSTSLPAHPLDSRSLRVDHGGIDDGRAVRPDRTDPQALPSRTLDVPAR